MTRSRDRGRAARAVEELLAALGYDLVGELEGTPERVASAWIDELVSGEVLDPIAILRDGSIALAKADHGVVVLRGISVATMCPHHLLPSHGTCTVAYIPGAKAAGLGALAGAVHALSRRLTLQESLGQLVADALVEGLEARGALCKLDLTHTCFVARGERESGSVLSTLALAGSFVDGDRDLALAMLSAPPTPLPSSEARGS